MLPLYSRNLARQGDQCASVTRNLASLFASASVQHIPYCKANEHALAMHQRPVAGIKGLQPFSQSSWHGTPGLSADSGCVPSTGLDVAGLFMNPNDIFCYVTHNDGLTTPVIVDSDMPQTSAPLVGALRMACKGLGWWFTHTGKFVETQQNPSQQNAQETCSVQSVLVVCWTVQPM